jgi:nitrite reductase (NADH) small subunit
VRYRRRSVAWSDRGEAEGVGVCLANVGGEVSAVANRCPLPRPPAAAGLTGRRVRGVPWHSWTFNLETGVAEYPVHERIAVFPQRAAGEHVLMEVGPAREESNSEPL